MSTLPRIHSRSTPMVRPRFRSFVLGLCGIVLALLAQKRLYTGQVGDAVLLFVVALGCFVWPMRAYWQAPLAVADRIGGRGGWSLLLRIVPGVAAFGLAYLGLHQFQGNLEEPPLHAWWLYIGSVALFLLFAWALDWGAIAEQTKGAATTRWRVGYRAMALLILLIALFMRLWRFDQFPYGLWYDEAENGLQALRILRTENYYPLFVGSIHAPAHYLYLIGFFFHYGEVSVAAIRWVSVVMGVATVGAAFVAGRELFGRPWGLVTAFVFAVARWNVNFSRIGMYNASTPLFELLGIAFLLRGIRRGRYLDYAIAGLALGLGLCFYAAFQIFIAATLGFLLLTAFVERGFFRRTWSGILVMLATTALVTAPVALYAYTKPDVYFERTKDTSIFADKTPVGNLAPWLATTCNQLPTPWSDRCTKLPRLAESASKHLLMFNYRGDPNGRHNLPNEPMLDNVLAALFALGVGLSLLRCWRPRALLLLIWLGAMLMGGVLSLGFEAPQSLRAIGTQPAAYLLAIMALHALWLAWRNSGGQRYPQLFALPLVGLLLWVGGANFYTYFFRQATNFAAWNAFSTPETLAAQILEETAPETEVYLTSYFHGHPTINFLDANHHPYQRLETTDHLPLPWPADKDVALIVNDDSRAIFEEAKRFYPNAYFQEFRAPNNGPTVLYYALLRKADIASIQGWTARYYTNVDWQAAPILERQETPQQLQWPADSPVSQPFSVEWQGVLDVKDYGTHQFMLQNPAGATLYIDESAILSGTGALNTAIMLAQGKHTLRLRAVGGTGPFSLAWRPPDRGPELLPAAALFVPPVTSSGLLGKYYPNGDWQGPEILARIDPQLNLYFHITPLPRPYTVEWTGKIAIPQSGQYYFGIESIDEAQLFIDEQEIATSPLPNQYQEGAIELHEGLHDIRVRFADRTDHTHINLFWRPPFATQQPLPTEVLLPPQGNYDHITLPAPSFVLDKASTVLPSGEGTPLTGAIHQVANGFNSPKGVAVGPADRIYVADTGNQRVVILSPDGTIVGQLTPPEPFAEPFDLVVDREGAVYVLDPTQARIAHFAADGTYVGDLPAEDGIANHARGIGIDPAGNLWVAGTASGRVAQLDAAGTTLQIIPVWPGDDSQPVDVAVSSNGAIFVTDAGLHKLVQFDSAGRRLLAWPLPVANTLDGSHLATDTAGDLYVSKPEPFVISRYTPNGDLLGDWTVGTAGNNIVKPIGVAVDPLNRVWFVDTVGGALYVIDNQSDQ